MKQEFGFVPIIYDKETNKFIRQGEMVWSFAQAVNIIDSETGFGHILAYKLADEYPNKVGVVSPQTDKFIGNYLVDKES